ncbi:gene transfer agent family protein [Rhodobacteraceae bacterium KN286]|uniref:Gene transfer agent family protein n=2 Tax=Oceanomicrobium pacificus TaxID=2692916 RepID=A0A6B0TU60_9RHOB|nr:gene transfer agent family protein [Oceanomicrobium pacificus]
MRLTLQALAELEEVLGTGAVSELVGRFERGAFSAGDLMALLHAGLRGGGWDIDRAGFAALDLDGSPVALAEAGARLLAAAFVPEGARAGAAGDAP